jgi:hypothetical protein
VAAAGNCAYGAELFDKDYQRCIADDERVIEGL